MDILIQNAKKMATSKINPSISMTFCECGENDSNGMEKLGQRAEKGKGLNLEDLKKGSKIAKKLWGLEAKIVSLLPLLEGVELIDKKGRTGFVHKAWVMRIGGFINAVLQTVDKTMTDLFKEINNVTWDNKFWNTRRKKVMNKRARENNCVADYSQKADFENKKGTIHDFKNLPLMSLVRKALYKMFGDKVKLLLAEGNRYPDGGTKKHGIGWHGDAERRIVICIRLMENEGASTPMHFQYFWQWKAVGKRLKMPLNAGDVYIMSEGAVGTEWLKKSLEVIPRHCTGAPKFTKDK